MIITIIPYTADFTVCVSSSTFASAIPAPTLNLTQLLQSCMNVYQGEEMCYFYVIVDVMTVFTEVGKRG